MQRYHKLPQSSQDKVSKWLNSVTYVVCFFISSDMITFVFHHTDQVLAILFSILKKDNFDTTELCVNEVVEKHGKD